MSLEASIIILGLLIFLTPFLGLPYSWVVWMIPVLGIIIMVEGVVLRARRLTSDTPLRSAPEVTPPPQVLNEAPIS